MPEEEEKVEMDDIPEHDRLETRLAVSGVGSRLGEGEGDLEGVSNEASRSGADMMRC